MHIHKPKAAHGVREFLSEIAVIVVRILIAIGIEQAVEAWHWAREVREARASLHREMDRTNEFFATRVAAEPCQKRRLDDTLAAIVEKIARHEPVPRVRPFHSIGNSLDDSDWKSYRAAQVLPHFDPRERAIMNNYLFQYKNVYWALLEELDAYNVLQALVGDPSRLGPADLPGLRVALHKAERGNLLDIIARGELDDSRRLGLTIRAPDARLAEACAPVTVTETETVRADPPR